ncbi:MAG: hypothetical protein Tp1122DCM00d2C27307611_16 [Prokaryotic dsDNA virus sp.]|nr:MAG: hypothetical protein Tp1122DCM00d2C27307611_16 [Prokaryotic dsDNA virus sp.]|tara:strand:- start:5163 stop:5354 length:192 start_codon:yes stop_codon:yes gene_type:complete
MITLPIRKQKDKKNCTKCNVELTVKNQKVYNGIKYGQCKKCIKKLSDKHNAKRKQALKESKWF